MSDAPSPLGLQVAGLVHVGQPLLRVCLDGRVLGGLLVADLRHRGQPGGMPPLSPDAVRSVQASSSSVSNFLSQKSRRLGLILPAWIAALIISLRSPVTWRVTACRPA